MDLTTMGIESLEAAMNVGSMVVDQIGNILHAVEEEDTIITCEASRCDW